jgi:hypothetical protein
LEIYTGELKGFTNVPDLKDARETELLPSMKKLLLDTLSSELKPNTEYTKDTEFIGLAINVAIEFCISLQAT